MNIHHIRTKPKKVCLSPCAALDDTYLLLKIGLKFNVEGLLKITARLILIVAQFGWTIWSFWSTKLRCAIGLNLGVILDQVEYYIVLRALNRGAIQTNRNEIDFDVVWVIYKPYSSIFFCGFYKENFVKSKEGTLFLSVFGWSSWVGKYFTNTLDSEISLEKRS